MHGYKVAQLPFRLSSNFSHHASDDLGDKDMGFLISLKVKRNWISGKWKLVATGRYWGDEVVQEYSQDQIGMLRLTGEPVTVSELAWNFYRAYKIVAMFRQAMGADEVLEIAARRCWNQLYRLIDRVMVANGIADSFSRELLNTELFLLTISPIRKREEE